MTSAGTLPVPNNPCHDAFTTKITLTVTPGAAGSDATVTGTGEATATTPVTCTIQPPQPPPLQSAALRIDGTFSNDTFRVHFTPLTLSPNPSLDGGFFANWCCPAPEQALPVKNGEVHTTVTVTDASNSKAGTSVNTWDLKRSCDPDLLSRALREFDTANSFAAAGVDELNKAAGNLRDFRNDYLKESGELGAEKASLLQLLGVVSHTAVEVVEVTAFYVGIGVTVEELYTKIIPAVRERNKLSKEAEADFKRAEQWAKRGNADLKQALAQGPCIDPVENRLNKALDDQRIEDQARKLINSWETNGYLYVNPLTGEVLDEGAALKQARAAVAGKARTPQIAAAAPRKIKANAAQLRAALSAVQRALAAHGKARGQAAKLQAATDKARARLTTLLRS